MMNKSNLKAEKGKQQQYQLLVAVGLTSQTVAQVMFLRDYPKIDGAGYKIQPHLQSSMARGRNKVPGKKPK